MGNAPARRRVTSTASTENNADVHEAVTTLKAMREPKNIGFEPTVLMTVDDVESRLPAKSFLRPLLRSLRRVARHETDVVMVLHLALYFTTSVPSAVYLYMNFSYLHGILHLIMQFYYLGTYTLMMHQHIHQRGILNKKFGLFDKLFPYITDPLMGHTWNTYYYHHVKHHHVEGNGPGDLSSTIRYQRDSVVDFLRYLGRFYFLVWLDLPLYFLRTRRPNSAFRTAGWELSTYLFYFTMSKLCGAKPTFFVYVAPFMIMRLGLMVGNWGQHAFVDPDEPDSDFRSSITLIDVPSNRFCFNDGYHTSHHLNPMRHWRDHPISFLEQKETYAKEGALVFHNIDFLMITVRLMMKDYDTLAKCLVPMGDQIKLSMEGRVRLLKRLTKRFTEEDVRRTFPQR
ncbi:hypothetical protein LMH87_002202 [Akanthomyces muscarius]|uniref:Fatty acid desaturase domain-containing protein n=1 Tax=Akanthomyces muscarius TaxID=2231603 RepID=A0A9W8Q789_AKAMU|nr:hypothetical protein LMH87_002202 [Akanthomyces muscarius]KAJ4147694.1 hypothetical protein LMH87_002202 [Akanthomyces muscarius]